jgi:cation diffusion facilitator CzcD-associated flavoprotein CzcO
MSFLSSRFSENQQSNDPVPGCKRLIVDPNYLKSLGRPNVDLNWDGIDEVVEEGIKTKIGDIIPFDIIIFATGYDTEPQGFNVRGNKGTTVQEFFQSRGGPASYLGTMIPGFPNVFMILGV